MTLEETIKMMEEIRAGTICYECPFDGGGVIDCEPCVLDEAIGFLKEYQAGKPLMRKRKISDQLPVVSDQKNEE